MATDYEVRTGRSSGSQRRAYVEGAGNVRKALRLLEQNALVEVKKAVEEAAQAVLADALKNVPKPGSSPYATGNLAHKLNIKFSRDGLKARVGSWGTNRARHIHLVEFGTRPHDITMPDGGVIHHPGAKPHPFLFPAYYVNRNWAVERIRAAVVKALEQAKRGNGIIAGEASQSVLDQMTTQDIKDLYGDNR